MEFIRFLASPPKQPRSTCPVQRKVSARSKGAGTPRAGCQKACNPNLENPEPQRHVNRSGLGVMSPQRVPRPRTSQALEATAELGCVEIFVKPHDPDPKAMIPLLGPKPEIVKLNREPNEVPVVQQIVGSVMARCADYVREESLRLGRGLSVSFGLIWYKGVLRFNT